MSWTKSPADEPKPATPESCCAEIAALVAQIEPLLSGKSPDVISAALCDITATFLAGVHPGFRDQLLEMMIAHIKNLIPVNEEMIFGDHGFPVTGIN